MQFTKFTLEHADIEVMRAAFNRVCDVLHLDCTEVVATKLMEFAKSGERDPERLCIGVLAGLQEALQSTADEEQRETVLGAGAPPDSGLI
jgi:hypothetical protein